MIEAAERHYPPVIRKPCNAHSVVRMSRCGFSGCQLTEVNRFSPSLDASTAAETSCLRYLVGIGNLTGANRFV